MDRSGVDQTLFEPTVTGAVRRHWALVLGVALLGGLLALGWGALNPPDYQATGKVTVRQPLLLAGQPSDQYLDSQVLVLQSPEVAERAAVIAGRARGAAALTAEDFAPEREALTVLPPEGATPGAYGANTITVTFAWPDATTARAGANAVLRAYEEQRSASIEAEGVASTAGIERAIDDARTEGQQNLLLNRRARVLVEAQLDLSRPATIVWAAQPLRPANGGLAGLVLTGLFVGSVLGAALAYLVQRRRRSFNDPAEPAAIYGAPLVHRVPASAVRDGEPLVMVAAPDTPGAEAFRFAAHFVERLHAGPGRVLCVLSPQRNPGRSASLANLTLALAEGGRQVLAVDADPTTGHLTQLLLPTRPLAPGLRQVLAGEAHEQRCVVASTWSAAAAVLPLGPAVDRRLAGPAATRTVRDVLDAVRTGYDIVLVDAPALLGVAEGLRTVQAADAAIVVVGEGDPVPAHQEAADLLDQLGVPVAGYLYVPEHGRRPAEQEPVPAQAVARSGTGEQPGRPPAVEATAAATGDPELTANVPEQRR